jgi:hypothetical protein
LNFAIDGDKGGLKLGSELHAIAEEEMPSFSQKIQKNIDRV